VLQPYIDALDFCGVALVVVPGAISLDTGATQQFATAASGILDTANNADVTWHASGGAIDQQGLYIAPAAAGVFTVTATSVLNAARTATATVTVGSCPAQALNARAFPGGNGRIAFQAAIPDGEDVTDWEIYAMGADGSAPTNLTSTTSTGAAGSNFLPSWSPDGARIAFARVGEVADPDNGLWVMNADGGGKTQVVPVVGAGEPA
jgi:hypothetical protein